MMRNWKEPRRSAFSRKASSRVTSASGWSTCPITHNAPSVIRATATVISAAAGPAAARAPATRTAQRARSLRISDQAPLGEIAHQRTRAEGPRLAIARMAHPVDEPAELRRRHRDDVADLVREALARRIAVLDRDKHGAEEQHGAVRILMVRPDHLRD